jgi:hypothetical protein
MPRPAATPLAPRRIVVLPGLSWNVTRGSRGAAPASSPVCGADEVRWRRGQRGGVAKARPLVWACCCMQSAPMQQQWAWRAHLQAGRAGAARGSSGCLTVPSAAPPLLPPAPQASPRGIKPLGRGSWDPMSSAGKAGRCWLHASGVGLDSQLTASNDARQKTGLHILRGGQGNDARGGTGPVFSPRPAARTCSTARSTCFLRYRLPQTAPAGALVVRAWWRTNSATHRTNRGPASASNVQFDANKWCRADVTGRRHARRCSGPVCRTAGRAIQQPGRACHHLCHHAPPARRACTVQGSGLAAQAPVPGPWHGRQASSSPRTVRARCAPERSGTRIRLAPPSRHTHPPVLPAGTAPPFSPANRRIVGMLPAAA